MITQQRMDEILYRCGEAMRKYVAIDMEGDGLDAQIQAFVRVAEIAIDILNMVQNGSRKLIDAMDNPYGSQEGLAEIGRIFSARAKIARLQRYIKELTTDESD